LGPTSKALIDRVKADVDTLKQENPSEPVPARPRHHIRQRS
jgi:K+-transporting ATPase ATPase C chain